MAIIVIDFDNTITSGESYPACDPIRPGAPRVINKYYDQGHCIIINTCRCGEPQDDAEQFLIDNGVKFCHINQNCNIRIEQYGNDTRKIGGDIFIDDKDIHVICSDYGIDWGMMDLKISMALRYINATPSRCNRY